MNLEKISFIRRQDSEKAISDAIKLKKKITANFLNSHDLYQFTKEAIFREAVLSQNSINFIDGFTLSVYLSLSNLTIAKRFRGPDFTERFLNNKQYSDKRMLFIGIEEKDLDNLSNKFKDLTRKNLFCYNPPFIKGIKFPEEEINKMIKIINSKKINFVWIAVGSPKQNILSNSLINETNANLFFNVGAAFDFLLGKKRRAPKFWQKFGIEWLYRFITDFKYSRKKVLKSFIALKYLHYARLKKKI